MSGARYPLAYAINRRGHGELVVMRSLRDNSSVRTLLVPAMSSACGLREWILIDRLVPIRTSEAERVHPFGDQTRVRSAFLRPPYGWCSWCR